MAQESKPKIEGNILLFLSVFKEAKPIVCTGEGEVCMSVLGPTKVNNSQSQRTYFRL